MSLEAPLARVLGLGSAKQGSGHWWAQRLTAIALAPLALWFVVSILSLYLDGDLGSHAAVVAWLAAPLR